MRITVSSIVSLMILSVTAFSSESASKLPGRWIRPNASLIGDKQEGFLLRPDGTGKFIGIHSINLVSWRLRGHKLIIETNTERYPKPDAATYAYAFTRDGSLTLQGSWHYLDGTFKHSAK